ncbi:hypothetical protein ACOMHN_037751 [Nucella lapillus]
MLLKLQAEAGHPCSDQSECGADECCQIVHIVIASKKRQLHQLKPGTCEKFRQQGDHCNHFDVMNGYCSCAPGLTCKTVHVSTTQAPSIFPLLTKRKLAPGYVSYCSN